MPDLHRAHDVSGMTSGDLERARRQLQASLALARPDSPARVPILAYLSAIDTELAQRAVTGPANDGLGRAAASSAAPALPEVGSVGRPVLAEPHSVVCPPGRNASSNDQRG